MGKNTLKGKAKLLSYFVAFIFMVGIHIAVDRTGKEGQESQEKIKYSGEKDSSASLAKAQDSLYNEMTGNPELTLLFKN